MHDAIDARSKDFFKPGAVGELSLDEFDAWRDMDRVAWQRLS